MISLFILFGSVLIAVLVAHHFVPHLSGRIGILLLLLGMVLTVVLHPGTPARIRDIVVGVNIVPERASISSTPPQKLSFSDFLALQEQIRTYRKQQDELKLEILRATNVHDIRAHIHDYNKVLKELSARELQVQRAAVDLKTVP